MQHTVCLSCCSGGCRKCVRSFPRHSFPSLHIYLRNWDPTRKNTKNCWATLFNLSIFCIPGSGVWLQDDQTCPSKEDGLLHLEVPYKSTRQKAESDRPFAQTSINAELFSDCPGQYTRIFLLGIVVFATLSEHDTHYNYQSDMRSYLINRTRRRKEDQLVGLSMRALTLNQAHPHKDGCLETTLRIGPGDV